MEKRLLVCDFCNGAERLAVNRHPLGGMLGGAKQRGSFIDVCREHDNQWQVGLGKLYKQIKGVGLPRGRHHGNNYGARTARVITKGEVIENAPPEMARRGAPKGATWKIIGACLEKTPNLSVKTVAERVKIDPNVVRESLYRARVFKNVTRSGARGDCRYQLTDKGKETLHA